MPVIDMEPGMGGKWRKSNLFDKAKKIIFKHKFLSGMVAIAAATVGTTVYIVGNTPDVSDIFAPKTPAEAFAETYRNSESGFFGHVEEMPKTTIQGLYDQYGPRTDGVPVSIGGNGHRFDVIFTKNENGELDFSLRENGKCAGAARPTAGKASYQQICANGE